MRVLLVVAHPLPDSLCSRLAAFAERQFEYAGCHIDRLNLYEDDFCPVMTPDERRSYGQKLSEPDVLANYKSRLLLADIVVIVFPTWWFSMPAILKGWLDRVWSPGTAFDPGPPMKPLLDSLKACLVITTLGAPAWVDYLIMRRPVACVLRRGLLRACAPQSAFQILSFYNSENNSEPRITKFERNINKKIYRLIRK